MAVEMNIAAQPDWASNTLTMASTPLTLRPPGSEIHRDLREADGSSLCRPGPWWGGTALAAFNLKIYAINWIGWLFYLFINSPLGAYVLTLIFYLLSGYKG